MLVPRHTGLRHRAGITGIARSLAKAHFWLRHCHDSLSPEQTKVLNRLLDGGEQGFENGISASQYQKVAGVSKATATRHLAVSIHRNSIDTGKMRRSSLDPTFLLA
ncbi:hypothetical protein N5J09_06115 [Aeromonas caviae]|nr:hypothetical protein [Aeromonas caviae]MDH1396504.1 hypothetical protein [Aeromonas caviae]